MGEPDDPDDCAAWDRACESAHRRMEEDAIEAHRPLSAIERLERLRLFKAKKEKAEILKQAMHHLGRCTDS